MNRQLVFFCFIKNVDKTYSMNSINDKSIILYIRFLFKSV